MFSCPVHLESIWHAGRGDVQGAEPVNFNVWNYQNSLPGVNLLLARATNFSTANLYTLATEGFLKVWMMGWLTIR